MHQVGSICQNNPIAYAGPLRIVDIFEKRKARVQQEERKDEQEAREEDVEKRGAFGHTEIMIQSSFVQHNKINVLTVWGGVIRG